jgi:hypothetical protein
MCDDMEQVAGQRASGRLSRISRTACGTGRSAAREVRKAMRRSLERALPRRARTLHTHACMLASTVQTAVIARAARLYPTIVR